MSSDNKQAWDTFWAREKRRGAMGGGGCLPSGWRGIDDMQTRAWQAFAKRLPKKARLLDVATGDGRVMRKILAVRPDLRPTGIDSATALPDAPTGTKSKGSIDMAALPFDDGHFGAATSQFGFEYGDMPAAAAELYRVLRTGGSLGILCHRSDSPIVAHNRARAEQIGWALDDRAVIAAAREALDDTDIAKVPTQVAAAPGIGADRFGEQSPAWEIAEAVRRTMVARSSTPRSQVAQILDTIESEARNELARIASLEHAAGAAGNGRKLDEVVLAAGFAPRTQDPLYDGPGRAPFGTFLTYVKPA